MRFYQVWRILANFTDLSILPILPINIPILPIEVLSLYQIRHNCTKDVLWRHSEDNCWKEQTFGKWVFIFTQDEEEVGRVFTGWSWVWPKHGSLREVRDIWCVVDRPEDPAEFVRKRTVSVVCFNFFLTKYGVGWGEGVGVVYRESFPFWCTFTCMIDTWMFDMFILYVHFTIRAKPEVVHSPYWSNRSL